MVARKDTSTADTPDQIPLTELQAARLSALTGVAAKELVGVRPVDLADRLRWIIDPQLFFYRRICGRVVKRDPVTGVDYPVPNATVHVEDTDCHFLFYSPGGSAHSWFFPFHCHREVIATVRTDACGRFCVWIPRWEIDWILTWRKRRFCFPIIFQRPSWRDILDDLRLIPRPIPDPDPGPLTIDRLRFLDRGLGGFGAGQTLRLQKAAQALELGESTDALNEALDENAFDDDLQPPLPEEFVDVVRGQEKRGADDVHSLIAESVASRAGIDIAQLSGLDLSRAIGPFRRCFTYHVPVWLPIFDVPDITFRVTQDVDGDGDEETIYSENYFQVRWNAGAIPDVTLRASSWARASAVCDAPPVLPCGDVPAINFAGLMPVTAAYHDNATGYAIRPNRPRPAGVPTSPATAPYCLNVNLFGCLVRPDGAAKYRLLYRYATHAGAAFSSTIPFTQHRWDWHPIAAPPVPSDPDPVAGWYNLPPAGLAGTPEESLLMPFDTTKHTAGIYGITVQIGDSSGTVLATSAEAFFTVDNRAPTILHQVRWSADGGSTWTVLPLDCPVVRRGATPADVLFEVTWNVMAPAHYRDSVADAAGCGASGPAPLLTPAGQIDTDWHTGPLDNARTYVLTYRLPSTHAEGTYSFGCHANSRAFNPSGYVAGYQTNDWLFDIGSPPIYDRRRIYFSVINA
jgi:hypothetical protein